MSPSLPRPPHAFQGRIGRLLDDSQAAPMVRDGAPAGAPNILLIMLDDVGFGSFGTFGGPVPTPALDAVARQGLRYNQFHTTALCSPTRAALLTGRNHHAVHMGATPDGANTFPGYDSVIPRSSATVAEILRQNGYATACFGKWHLTPSWEQGPAGPFDRWPTGMGFERFYGIISAEASQWEPAVYDQINPILPYEGRPDYHLTEDLVDQSITWLQKVRATAPNRPWFLYLPTPAVHTPHHAPKAWIDRFAGQFDAGWDVLRQQIFERQLAQGVIPPNTTLTPRPAEIPAWEDYPDRFKPAARRLMETFAGFLAHTDHHIGRLLQAVEASGEADNTLVVYITGDNGASAEGTLNGAWAAPSFQNGMPEDPEWILAHMDDFGSARCENHYNVGWAWALDAPFQWMKQVASHFGGTRNAMALCWPAAIADAGGLRSQFHHVNDIAPTLLAAAGIETPTTVNGVAQDPMDGVSMTYSFADPAAPSAHTTQYFEILGNRAIYHDGWMASCFHGRVPWIRFVAAEFDGPQERWELYNIAEDFSQGRDLSAEFPEKLEELKALFDAEARRNSVYPLRDPSRRRDPNLTVPTALGGVRSVTYTPAHVRIPETIAVNLKNCSFRIAADISVAPGGARGVIACQGGNMAGWSLYLDEAGVPHFLYNYFGRVLTDASASEPLAPGDHLIEVRFAYDGGLGGGGDLTLSVDGADVGAARLEATVPVVFSVSGETFDIGVDTGAPVGPYPHIYRCTATIRTVTLERLTGLSAADREDLARREFRASISSQ